MELLAVNQPWNLIIFMGIPIVLAETLAITELYILFTRKFDGLVDKNKDREGKLKIHAICIALFLIFGHIAMIFGMIDPSILGHEGMAGMAH
jgi:hypothetical protein